MGLCTQVMRKTQLEAGCYKLQCLNLGSLNVVHAYTNNRNKEIMKLHSAKGIFKLGALTDNCCVRTIGTI